MTIETARVPGHLLSRYAAIHIAFDVTSRLVALRRDDGSWALTEHAVHPPYIKDYDAVSERPHDWPARFDTSQWLMLMANVEGVVAGGATLAYGGSGLDMLEGRRDLAVLWDIRVEPALRGRGVGRALFQAVEVEARARGCVELTVETQNVNVPACRFYSSLGCHLRDVRSEAYPSCPGEDQFLWYKSLTPAVLRQTTSR